MKFEITTFLSVVAFAQSKFISDPLDEFTVFNDDNKHPTLEEVWGTDWPFQGVNTFAHLDHHKCLLNTEKEFDIAVIGVPFDTATSYRPGARFGPRSIRAASQRQTALRGFNQRANLNPYTSWAKVIDCGDIPVTPMDNSLAFKQMTKAFEELLTRKSTNEKKPRFVALGGDHSVILPHLRALHKIYGPVNLIHFDAHLDTWAPSKYPSFWHSDQLEINHGSMLWKAHQEGLLTDKNVHVGLRTKLSGLDDYEDDDTQDYLRITADDVWIKGAPWIVKKIIDRVPKDRPTYISVDVDVLDPAFTSGTGTQEPGGFLPRELLYILRNIDSLSVVGADVVEVSPAFDHAEITSTNGAQIAYELITSMVKTPSSFEHSEAFSNIDIALDNSIKNKLQQRLQELETTRERLLNEIAKLNSYSDQKAFIPGAI